MSLLLCLLPGMLASHVYAQQPDDAYNRFVDRSATEPSQLLEQKLLITLEKGQPLLVQLESLIDTDKSQLNDPIEASLVQDVYVGQVKIFPRLTRFYGQIAWLDIPLAGRNPIMKLVFDTYQLPNGGRYPMQAVVRTERPDHLLGGELTEGTQPKLVRHGVWGIGYYNQVIMTGPRKRGEAIKLEPGHMMMLLLEAPLTITHISPWVEVNPHRPWP